MLMNSQGYTPVASLNYHVVCLTDQQLISIINIVDDSVTSGNWTYNASVEVNKLYSAAVHWSINQNSASKEITKPPIEVNLTLREQKHINRKNPLRKKNWDASLLKWQQEAERKWEAKNAREVASLRSTVCFIFFLR